MTGSSTALPPLREVIRTHDLRARKSLGQNFLLDLNLTGRIARSAGDLSQTDVIEIGPGPGGLTRALLDAGARKVMAIERDSRCLAALAAVQAHYGEERLVLVEGDALEADVWSWGSAPRAIVANLPYNIATPLLIRWLGHAAAFDRMILMFQSEVADRLVAKPNTKAYGRLSVLTQWLCEVERLINVPAAAFTPPPKVASTVVGIFPRRTPLAAADQDALETVTAAAFGQRRKMLRASLKSLKIDFESVGIEPTARAEDVDVEGFCALARAVSSERA